MFETIEQIKDAAKNSGRSRYFFAVVTTRAFGTRVHSKVYGGHYFVTSQQEDLYRGTGRTYAVHYASDDGEIATMDDFGRYATARQAHQYAQRLADLDRVRKANARKVLEAIRQQFKPYIDAMEGWNSDQPKLVQDYRTSYGRRVPWAIIWEDGAPFEWTLAAFQKDAIDDEMTAEYRAMGVDRIVRFGYVPEPKEVHCEAENGYVLGIYDA